MTDTEKLNLIINKLKQYAESKHCYETEGDDFSPSIVGSYDGAFDVGAEYGEILFARTMLESMGVDFEYPCEKKEND